MSRESLRILYAAGPGDVIGTYKHWSTGHDDPAQVAITYSAQFYDLLKETGAVGLVISSNPEVAKATGENICIEQRRTFFSRGPGALYHLGQVWAMWRLVISAIRFRADGAVIADATHWFALAPMAWFGVKVVPTLHCVLWPKTKPPSGRIDKLVWWLNRRFFRKHVAAVMSLSSDITQQVLPMFDGKPVPVISFLPTYRCDSFGDGFGPPSSGGVFRVFFAGRIERNKGVYDLLEIARQFKHDGIGDIEFDLCGSGSQLESLRELVTNEGLSGRFRLHGHTARPQMMQLYEQCHVVIVPTTTDFVEGFNKVVAEGVLAGRPVVTSSVCPALEYVREAVVEVPPDQWEAYRDAILQLKTDPALYETKRMATRKAREQFYDVKRGWKRALRQAVGLGS